MFSIWKVRIWLSIILQETGAKNHGLTKSKRSNNVNILIFRHLSALKAFLKEILLYNNYVKLLPI